MKIIMWRMIHPLARYNWYYQLTQQYKISEKLIAKCKTVVEDLITAKRSELSEKILNLMDAKSFLEYMCLICQDTTEIRDEVINIIFAVSVFRSLYKNCI